MSRHWARHALNIDRSTVRCASTQPDDAQLREAMNAVASQRPRFGYQRVDIMLDRHGVLMNQNKLWRLCREEKLQVCRRGGRKRALGRHGPMLMPTRTGASTSPLTPLPTGGASESMP
jgi:putative transposase